MFEDVTYEKLLGRMLDAAGGGGGIDVREGSVIYSALAPAAAELQNMYIQLDNVLKEAFADTASREYLVRRAAERGIVPEAATYAVVKGSFNIPVPQGTVFSCGEQNYTSGEKAEDGCYLLSCTKPGASGNIASGRLIPVEYIDGLEAAQIVGIAVPGKDEEATEKLRQRYFESLTLSPFGGNIKDYKEKTSAIPGVGGVKVYPVHGGPGTVKLVIISSALRAPSAELVSSVLKAAAPVPGGGEGFAPIGHSVSVAGCTETEIDISCDFTYETGYSFESVKNDLSSAAEEYFRLLAAQWDSSEALTVRISRLEACFLDIEGIVDVSGTKLNGAAQNIVLGADSIPVLGVISENE